MPKANKKANKSMMIDGKMMSEKEMTKMMNKKGAKKGKK